MKLEMIIDTKSNDEGVYIALCSEDDEKVFSLTPKNGVWVFVGEEELVTEPTPQSEEKSQADSSATEE